MLEQKDLLLDPNSIEAAAFTTRSKGTLTLVLNIMKIV